MTVECECIVNDYHIVKREIPVSLDEVNPESLIRILEHAVIPVSLAHTADRVTLHDLAFDISAGCRITLVDMPHDEVRMEVLNQVGPYSSDSGSESMSNI